MFLPLGRCFSVDSALRSCDKPLRRKITNSRSPTHPHFSISHPSDLLISRLL